MYKTMVNSKLPVFGSEVKTTMTLVFQLNPYIPLHSSLHELCKRHQQLYNPVREKVWGMAHNENPMTKWITEIKWHFIQLGLDAILLRHWPVSGSAGYHGYRATTAAPQHRCSKFCNKIWLQCCQLEEFTERLLSRKCFKTQSEKWTFWKDT